MASLMHPELDDPVISKWCGKLRLANHGIIKNLLQKICFEHLRSPAGSTVLLSGLLLQTVAEIIRGTQLPKESLNPLHWDRMQRAIENIHEQADGTVSVDSLAQGMRLSTSHFRRLFRETHGQSPRAVHRNARIQKARELLIYSDLTVSEIAFQLGFSTVHNFSRAFKQVMGVSPTEYRQGQISFSGG
jgi:AraC-like DNA-binding protein